MLDPKNVVCLTGGLLSDPEVIKGKHGNIYKIRLGVDNAGNEGGSYGKSGYFDAVCYEDANNSGTTTFLATQIAEEKMKKGSRISIVGRLMHDRWVKDGVKGQKVSLVIESLSYASSGPPPVKEEVSPPSATDEW